MIPTPPPAASCLPTSAVIEGDVVAAVGGHVPLIRFVFHQSTVVEEKHFAFCPKQREETGDGSRLTRR